MVNAKAKELVDQKVVSKKVIVFSKTSCPYCTRTKSLLKEYKLSSGDLEIVEIDRMDHSEMSAIQDYLQSITGARSVPRVFVNGKSLGGNDDTHAAHRNGSLRKIIEG